MVWLQKRAIVSQGGTGDGVRFLTNNFRVLANFPYAFVIGDNIDFTVVFEILNGSSNDDQFFVGNGLSNGAVGIRPINGGDLSFWYPTSANAGVFRPLTGVGDLQGTGDHTIRYLTTSSGTNLQVFVDGVERYNDTIAATETINMDRLFRTINPNFNSSVIIKSMSLNNEGTTTIDMPLDGDFSNNGTITVNPTIGVEGTDYEFV